MLHCLAGFLMVGSGSRQAGAEAGANQVLPVDSKGDPAVVEYARRFVSESGYPGVWVAVAKGGRFFGACAVGYKDRENRTPAKLTDRIRWGSISKPVVGALAAELVRQGRTSFDRRLFEAVPQAASQANPAYAPVTLEQLLSHSAGFERDGIQPKTTGGTSPADFPRLRWEMLRGSIAKPPVAAPTKSYLYSNVGVTLAAMMLEQGSGMSFERLPSKTATERWGLATMGTGEPPREYNTRPYQFRAGRIEPSPAGTDWRYSYLPSASVHSTIEDMCGFGLLHCTASAFPKELLVSMHQVQPPENTTRSCFKRADSGNGRYLLTHGGALSNRNRGDVAWMIVEPATGTVVAAYTNVCDENKPSGENLVLTALNQQLSRPLFSALRR